MSSLISRNVQYVQPHRVFFTDGVFDEGNECLAEAMRGGPADGGRRRRVLVVIESAVAAGQVGLEEAVRGWFGVREGAWELAGEPLVFGGGEPCKNDWERVEGIWAAINRAAIDRHSFVVAIGGGAFLDLVGFAAATAHRGVRHVRMPTTTLSQGDGGVGGEDRGEPVFEEELGGDVCGAVGGGERPSVSEESGGGGSSGWDY